MKKALKIGLISIVVALVAFATISYFVWKEETTLFFNSVVEFINKPLPIVGVSIAIIGGFIYKIFVSTNYGKNAINKYKNELEKTKEELLQKERELCEKQKEIAKIVDENREQVDFVFELLDKLCDLTHNVHANEIKELIENRGANNGEEEIDSNPTEE